MKNRIETHSQRETFSEFCRINHHGVGWVVVEKPAGIATGSSASSDGGATVAGWARLVFPGATGPMVVHRLDRATSGLVVVALDPATHALLSGQFRERLVHKRYDAIVSGTPHDLSGTVRLPIARERDVVDGDWDDDDSVRRVAHRDGKPAMTFWRVKERGCSGATPGTHTHIELWPITGRTHQIRVHCATGWIVGGIGRPIVGDTLYGTTENAGRMLLHASSLSFIDPATNGRVVCESTPSLLRQCGQVGVCRM